jgi:hypothetical protein
MYECECSVTAPVTNLSEKDENGERCSTCPDNISGNGKGQSAELNAAKNLALHRAEVNMYEVPLEEECHPDGFNLNTKCRCWRNRHYQGDDRGERLEVDPETGKVLPPQSIS